MMILKKKNFDGLILDVDGTLWDSTEIVAKAWTKAAVECGIEDVTITSDMLKQLFGLVMTEIADRLFPDCSVFKRDRVLELCCKYEHEALEADECNICYLGVVDTIKEISERVPVFIVSNCQSGYIELFMDKTGLNDYITDTECFGDTGKTKGENISLLMERNNLKSPVYVGDTQGDCDAAKVAGIPFIYATYGFRKADSAYAEITEFSQLKNIL